MRIEEFAKVMAATHFIQASHDEFVARLLGLIPAVLGSMFGVGVWPGIGLVDASTGARIATGALLLAGIASTVIAFLSPDKSSLDHRHAAHQYKTLENQARRSYQIYAREDTHEAFLQRVEKLAARYDTLGEQSAQTGDRAYKTANDRTKAGTYDSDKVPPSPTT